MHAGMYVSAGLAQIALAPQYPAGLQQIVGDEMLHLQDEKHRDRHRHHMHDHPSMAAWRFRLPAISIALTSSFGE